VALAIIGCGADANPEPRRNLDDAKQHGAALAAEVNRMIAARSGLTPLPGRITGKLRRLDLPLEPAPSRAAIADRTRLNGAPGFFARTLLERLDRGEPIPTSVPYVVQTWSFGDDMAVVFLAGEVVVDYALRLKWEIDANRLWIAAYSNDVPCYIPSRRVLSEGGYEADSSLIYYGHASRLTPAVEDLIVGTVHDILPASFDGPRK
jgi:neutral ceramidase